MNGSKRHLPPWVLLRNSSETEEGKAKAKGATVAADADDDDDDDHQKETRTQTSRIRECTVVKRRRRKLIEEHPGADADADATRKAKKKRDDSSNKTPRPHSPPIHHHHVELTMADLLAIAHEYVNDDKKKQKEATSRQSGSLNQFIKTGEYAHSPDSHSQRQTSSTSEWEGLYSSTSHNTRELLPTTTSQTADPAQQMLHILLGPLLKPLQKEKQKEKNKSIIHSVEFTQDLPGKDLVQLSGEDKAPLTKRKYSLKDKVGLFLD